MSSIGNRLSLKPFLESYIYLLTAMLLNIPLVGVSLLSNLGDVDFSFATWIYSICVIIGYYILPLHIVVTLLYLLLFPLRRTRLIVSGLVMIGYVFYLLVDSFVYKIAKFHIDFFWLEYLFRDFKGLGLPDIIVVISLGALLLVIALEIGVFKWAARMKRRRHLLLSVPLLLISAFAVSQVLHIFAYSQNDNRITSLTPHFPMYVPFTSHRNALKYEDKNPLTAGGGDSALEEYAYSSLNYPLSEMRYGEPQGTATPNVLFLLLESWRGDQMDDEVSPNIAALGHRGSVFRDHISGGNQTTCGIFSLFYGLHPTYWTAIKSNSALIDNPVLIDVMQDRDYAFGIFARSKFKRHKIQDTIFNTIEIHEDFAGRTIQENDADLNRQLIEFIREQAAAERPFMSLAFYKATHFSYSYPEEHAVFTPSENLRMGFTSQDTDPEPYLNDYRNAIHYNDALIGEVIAELEALGLMDETIIIVTSDHGESFNDNAMNYWGHGSNFTRHQIQVPLIIYAPGRAPAVIDQRTAHVDVAPSLLTEYFACTTDIRDYSNGRNLYSPSAGDRPLVIASYFNHAFILGESVFEIFPMYTRKYDLQDIRKEAARPRPEQLRTVMESIKRFYN